MQCVSKIVAEQWSSILFLACTFNPKFVTPHPWVVDIPTNNYSEPSANDLIPYCSFYIGTTDPYPPPSSSRLIIQYEPPSTSHSFRVFCQITEYFVPEPADYCGQDSLGVFYVYSF